MSDVSRANPAVTESRGSCMCGRVRFVALAPSRFACHCHCVSCRRSHSAGYVSWLGYPSAQVTVEAGADELVAYESSPGARRSFCRVCGTKLFFESDRWAGEIHIARAAFTTPVDREPVNHVFFDQHVAWVPVVPPPGGVVKAR
jgi:hypothetical protein